MTAPAASPASSSAQALQALLASLGNGSSGSTDPSAVASVWGLAPTDMGVGVPGTNVNLQQALASLGQSDPQSLAEFQQQLLLGGYYEPYLKTGQQPEYGILDTPTYNAYKALLIDAVRGNTNPNTLLSEQVRAKAQTPNVSVSPRTLGLGKYAIQLTNPDDVKMVADTTAEALLGRKATAQEQAKILSTVQTQESEQHQAEFQQYTTSQEAFYEAQHGGVAGAQAAAPPAAQQAAPAPPPLPLAEATPGSTGSPVNATGLNTGVQMAQPIPGVQGPVTAQEAAQYQQAQAAPPQQAAAAATSLPAGAVITADGTVLIPPQQFVTTNAASPQAAAYAYYNENDPTQVRAMTVANAMQGIANFIKQK